MRVHARESTQTQLPEYFTDVLRRLRTELDGVLLLERRQMVIDAHRLLHTTDFDSFVALDGPSASGSVQLRSEEALLLQYPDLGFAPRRPHARLPDLVARARRLADSFFKRSGHRLQFRPQPIGHDDVHALLLELEALDVVVRGLCMGATTRFERQVLDSIKGLAEVLSRLPRPGVDVQRLRQRLDAVEGAVDALTGTLHPSSA